MFEEATNQSMTSLNVDESINHASFVLNLDGKEASDVVNIPNFNRRDSVQSKPIIKNGRRMSRRKPAAKRNET